ncbi:MAG: 4-hydroxy-tetrahydrodipicolinate synthase [Spirochaetales bacterium]|nr:4-hydroxy-tetrahydrodipicolinate synthase [Spirochaetales bacterium]
MKEGKDIKGVIPALVTPFDKNDRVDLKAVEKITEFLVSNGVHALMPVGGTGEFPNLLREEKRDVVKAVASVAKGKIPIVPGTAACSTKEVIMLSNDAYEAGADAVIATAPYYFRLPESSLIEHYKSVAANISCPLIVYNNPLYTGNNMNPELIAGLMNEKNIIGVKQSNSDMGQLVELLRLAPKGLSLCTGIDSQFYPALCVGAVGIYSTAAGIIPAQMVELYNLFKAGKHAEALELHMKLQVLNKYLEYDPGYVAPAKEALNLLGLPGGYLRSPLPELTPEEKKGIKSSLKEIGVL